VSISLTELLAAIEDYARHHLPEAQDCQVTFGLADGRKVRLAVQLAGPSSRPAPQARKSGPLTRLMQDVLAVLTDAGKALALEDVAGGLEKALGKPVRGTVVSGILGNLQARGLVQHQPERGYFLAE